MNKGRDPEKTDILVKIIHASNKTSNVTLFVYLEKLLEDYLISITLHRISVLTTRMCLNKLTKNLSQNTRVMNQQSTHQ